MGLPPPVWEEIGNRIRETMRSGVEPASTVRDETGHYLTGTGGLRETGSVQSTAQTILAVLDSPDGSVADR